ncbi:MAG TPA: M48 family metalloprotease [Opitutaceae bacterium]|nr:M48 family metalloprotease [Opitutaceae bacterium]
MNESSAPPLPATATSSALDPAAVRAWFTGPVRPAKLSPLYRAGLAVTACAMVLLPVVYLALVAGAVWGVWLWLSMAYPLLGHGLMGIVAFAAPVFAGGTVVFFLFKPLLARAPKPPQPVVLDLAREPVLAAFLTQLCAAVGAPRPAVVQVDCMVNASASFRRGWLSVPTRELALTIGLPLAAGLDARQLAGVLAHEFGHFAQGAGMSATFVIRSVNAWFARVVFERDEWDLKLETLSKQGDFRLMLVAAVARGAVWLARKVLHGLMLAGHAISCFQLRQMEFDADHYEIQLAGTSSHLATSRELRLLNLAFGHALTDLRTLWQDGQLADDLPEFVRIRRSGLTATEIAEADKQSTEQPTKWHHTHPSDRARTAAAKAAASAGVFALDAPAASLFADFGATCRAASLAWYRAQQGLSLKPDSLVPTAALLAQADVERAARQAFDEWLGPAVSLDRPLTFTLPRSDDACPAVELLARRERAAEELPRLRRELEPKHRQQDEADLDTFNAWAAGRLLDRGMKVTPRSFGLTESTQTAVIIRKKECENRDARLAAELQPVADHFLDWLAATVSLARRQSSVDATALVRLAETFALLGPAAARFAPLAREVRLFGLLVTNAQALSGNPSFGSLVHETRTQLREHLQALLAAAESVPYPFSKANLPPLSVAEHLRQSHATGPTEIEAQAHDAVQEFVTLYFRLVARLLLHGRKLEAAG